MLILMPPVKSGSTQRYARQFSVFFASVVIRSWQNVFLPETEKTLDRVVITHNCTRSQLAYVLPVIREQAGMWGTCAQAYFGRFGEKPYVHSFR